ncbi:MAG TPA: hypothetical protein VM010_00480, partial [Chitinophagaceae bacterium]|nr:hypothetical protein [Chitinophagaceae bacterium]
MHPFSSFFIRLLLLALLFVGGVSATAQQVTGLWHGRIDGRKVELKLIQKGDSLTGTSYYFESPQRYTQYSVRGYFDATDNSVVWWDEVLLAQRGTTLLHRTDALLSVADFNCPGSGRMLLQGKAKEKEAPEVTKGNVDLTKTDVLLFPDAWDYVLDNFTMGTNDPDVIDSIALVAFTPDVKRP